jgi:hypothetical protein
MLCFVFRYPAMGPGHYKNILPVSKKLAVFRWLFDFKIARGLKSVKAEINQKMRRKKKAWT